MGGLFGRIRREIPAEYPAGQRPDAHHLEKIIVDEQQNAGEALSVIVKAHDTFAPSPIRTKPDIYGRSRNTRHLRLGSELRPQPFGIMPGILGPPYRDADDGFLIEPKRRRPQM